jgi:hypothetical protein
MLKAALIAAAVSVSAQAAFAAPIPLKMALGSDSITVHGVLSQKTDCCTYTFKAEAGQQLYWRETGAATRLTITNPAGETDGPNFESPTTLPASGVYTLSVSPDTMADHAYGRFTLTLRIPPKH